MTQNNEINKVLERWRLRLGMTTEQFNQLQSEIQEIPKQIFDDIEEKTKSLGIEKLAKEFPDYVHYVTFNYKDWQELKKKWCK